MKYLALNLDDLLGQSSNRPDRRIEVAGDRCCLLPHTQAASTAEYSCGSLDVLSPHHWVPGNAESR